MHFTGMPIIEQDINPVTGVLYAYSDRKNGWYCYAHNEDGDQIGAAEYHLPQERRYSRGP